MNLPKSLVFLVFFLGISWSACKEKLLISVAEKESIVGLGHGGMGINSGFPLNSEEGINKCLALGLDGSELDVQMTADSVLVAFHDVDLSDATKLEGRIHEKTWEELKAVSLSGSLRGECLLVSLTDLLEGVENPGEYFFTFDCKLHKANMDDDTYNNQFVRAFKRVLDLFQLGDRIAIESQDEQFLTICQQSLPQCGIYYYPSSFEEGFTLATSRGFDGITIASDNITAAEVQKAHQAGLKVALWNVKSGSDNWDAINKRPDFIQSDDPRHLKNALK